MKRCVPWWMLLVVSIMLCVESVLAFFAVRQRDELRDQLDAARVYEYAAGDVSDKCQADLHSCQMSRTCPEIEHALDCSERDRDAWKKMAGSCVNEALRVRAN